MNITSFVSRAKRATVAKLLTAGFLAGAVALAVPAKADAQEVFFTTGPHYQQAFFDRHRRFEYDRFRAEQFRRREEFRREEFRRHHFDHRYDRGYDRGYYR